MKATHSFVITALFAAVAASTARAQDQSFDVRALASAVVSQARGSA
jgi:hypothetical protein